MRAAGSDLLERRVGLGAQRRVHGGEDGGDGVLNHLQN